MKVYQFSCHEHYIVEVEAQTEAEARRKFEDLRDAPHEWEKAKDDGGLDFEILDN